MEDYTKMKWDILLQNERFHFDFILPFLRSSFVQEITHLQASFCPSPNIYSCVQLEKIILVKFQSVDQVDGSTDDCLVPTYFVRVPCFYFGTKFIWICVHYFFETIIGLSVVTAPRERDTVWVYGMVFTLLLGDLITEPRPWHRLGSAGSYIMAHTTITISFLSSFKLLLLPTITDNQD